MKAGTVILLAVGAFVLYNEHQKKNNVPRIFYRRRLLNNHTGLTVPPIGIFIKESEKNNIRLLHHEMVHWQQYQREGLINFALNYRKEQKANGYDRNKYEIEARKKSGEKCDCITNYTECVRSGKALTVHNPALRT